MNISFGMTFIRSTKAHQVIAETLINQVHEGIFAGLIGYGAT
ncbi:hypothetical protein PN457_09320 [Anabaenopsis arnoldii]|uniref:Uncharacterized protein n=1 Tax=Anabaenopsis arnoldii TaxID=2152938 RepID=A0ABT5ATV5_9CYAN|nr:hypothetical protein [Anabaenopsis arnoldii]